MDDNIFTLDEINTQIAAYKSALQRLASGKSVTVGLRTYNQQDLPEVRNTLTWLSAERSRMSGGMAPGPVSAVPRIAR